MADRQRIVLTGAGDQEVNYTIFICWFQDLIDSYLARHAYWRCDFCAES
jgi:hypothetical protein